MYKNIKPKISVLVLSYNHVQYLRNCLNSVFINRSDRYEIELIVLDDGSNDGSVEVLREIKKNAPIDFKLILKKHGGVESIPINFNEMIRLASGDYIAFLASDDQYVSERFFDQLLFMERNDNYVAIYANGINKSEDIILGCVHPENMNSLFEDSSGRELFKYLTTKVPSLFIQSILVRSAFLKNYEAFDNDLIADDWVFNIKLLQEVIKHGKMIYYMDKVVFIRNLHQSNTSLNYSVQYNRIRQVVERYSTNKKRLINEVAVKGMIRSLMDFDLSRFSFYLRRSINTPFLFVYSLIKIALNFFKK